MIEEIPTTGVIEFHSAQKLEPLHVLVALAYTLTQCSNGNATHLRNFIHYKSVRELLTIYYITIIALLAGLAVSLST
jgi:hypothetical protein